jgi:hypothetical protein
MPCKGEMCYLRTWKTATSAYFSSLIISPLRGFCSVVATIRRLRYRSTAGYAHLAPCGAKREKQNKTPNPVDSAIFIKITKIKKIIVKIT